MSLFDEIFEKTGPLALIGIGAALVAPVVIPVLGGAFRPVIKSAVRGYLEMTEKAKEVLGEAGEQLSDIIAEVRAEREADARAAEEARSS